MVVLETWQLVLIIAGSIAAGAIGVFAICVWSVKVYKADNAFHKDKV